MKKISSFIVFIFLALSAFSQSYFPIGVPVGSNGTGNNMSRLNVLNTLYMPHGGTPTLKGGLDSAGAWFYSSTDSTVNYYIGGGNWIKIKNNDFNIAILPTIASLQSYADVARTILVTDSLRGGIFNFYTSGTNDNGIVFTATGLGAGVWKRQYFNHVNIKWFGANSGNSAAANSTIITNIILAGYENIYIPQGTFYDPETIISNNLNGVLIYDENQHGIAFGKGANLQYPISNPTHLSLRPLQKGRITGLWVGGNGTYPFTPDNTGIYNAIKLSAEDFETEIAAGTNNYTDFTTTISNDGFDGFGTARFNTKGNGDFQGGWLSTELVFQNSNYRVGYWANLQHEPALVGSQRFYQYGGHNKAFWYAGRPTTTGDVIVIFFRVYQAASTGTTGSTKPTWTSGTQSDGGVSWTFVEDISQNASGNRHRPAFIFGDYNTAADVPAIGFNDAVVQFAEGALFHPATKLRFINGAKTEGKSYITRLSQTTPGIQIMGDSTLDAYAYVSGTRLLANNIPFIPTIISKADGATTVSVATGNNVAFNDASPTNFTAFTSGIAGQTVIARFNTAQTTLVNSASLVLGGTNITPAANAVYLFNIGTGSLATLVAQSDGITGLANPSASLGLTAVNGTATTAMRSDAAPALDQSISPTWTGTHIFNNDNTVHTVKIGLGASSVATNTMVGVGVMQSATGSSSSDVGVGYNALNALTSGNSNTGIGKDALKVITTAVSNTAVGTSALAANTADDNTAVGRNALLVNTSGTQNTAVGKDALSANLTSNNNTAVGYRSLQNTTGNQNTSVGNINLSGNTTGSNNTAIGYNCLVNNTTGSNNVAIGRGAGNGINASDKLYISSETTVFSLIYGDFNTNQLYFGGQATAPTLTTGVTVEINGTTKIDGGLITPYVAKTGTYTITGTDGTIDCTSGTFTVTLPTAVGITGQKFIICNSGAGTITVGTTSSQTFANVSGTPTTLTMSTVGTRVVQSNGANWILISSL